MTKVENVRYRRNGDANWQRHGSAALHTRYFEPVEPQSRRRCRCGCKRRASHRGMANGVCLSIGCELSMARWARNPSAAIAQTPAR